MREVHIVDIPRYGKTIYFRHHYFSQPMIYTVGRTWHKKQVRMVCPVILGVRKNSVRIGCFVGKYGYEYPGIAVKGKVKIIIEGVGKKER